VRGRSNTDKGKKGGNVDDHPIARVQTKVGVNCWREKKHNG